jgi:predicted membrane channel-forming protein YqfA (hemolysin III family)
MSIIAFFVTLTPKFYEPSLRKYRAALFVVVGIGSAFPAIYYVFYRDSNYIPYTDWVLWALGGAFYIGGAAIYAARIPERWWPGTFDFVVSFSFISRVLLTTFGMCASLLQPYVISLLHLTRIMLEDYTLVQQHQI